MFDAIFGRSVKILKILAKVQCVLAFVLASMLCGAVHEMLKPFSRFSAIVLGLVTWLLFLSTPAGAIFPAQLAGLLAALAGMLIGSLGPQAIRNSHASHHKMVGVE